MLFNHGLPLDLATIRMSNNVGIKVLEEKLIQVSSYGPNMLAQPKTPCKGKSMVSIPYSKFAF